MPDDAPTVEEEVLDVDGTNTDQLDAKYRIHVVAASEADSGTVEFDERGQPRWKYRDNQPNRDPGSTFDLLKALDNDAIVIDEPAAPASNSRASLATTHTTPRPPSLSASPNLRRRLGSPCPKCVGRSNALDDSPGGPKIFASEGQTSAGNFFDLNFLRGWFDA